VSRKPRVKCLICGRIFPRGQGITLRIDERELTFHSKKCALKFFNRLIEQLIVEDRTKVISALNKLLKTIEQEQRELEKLKAKKI